MEDRVNKDIAGKLDSLDFLPHGYTPNLDSKWALLERGMDKPAVSGGYVFLRWAGIAASVVLLCGIGWCYSRNEVKHIAAKGNSDVRELRKLSIGLKEEIINTKDEIPVRKLPVPFHSEKNSDEEIALLPERDLMNTQANSDVSLVDSSEAVAAVEVVPEVQTRKKKPRYVQVDFNGPAPLRLPDERGGGIAQFFRIKINDDGVGERVSNSYPEYFSPISIRHNLN